MILKTLKQVFHSCLLVDIYLMNPNQAAINYSKMINSSKKIEYPVLESKLPLTPPSESPPPDEGGWGKGEFGFQNRTFNFFRGIYHFRIINCCLIWIHQININQKTTVEHLFQGFQYHFPLLNFISSSQKS